MTTRFEDGLRSRLLKPEYAAHFLEAVMRDGDKEEIANAIQLIAEAQGMQVTVTAPETQLRIQEALSALQGAYLLTAPTKRVRRSSTTVLRSAKSPKER